MAMQAIDSGTLAGATSEMLGWLSNNAAGMIDFHTQQLNYWKQVSEAINAHKNASPDEPAPVIDVPAIRFAPHVVHRSSLVQLKNIMSTNGSTAAALANQLNMQLANVAEQSASHDSTPAASGLNHASMSRPTGPAKRPKAKPEMPSFDENESVAPKAPAKRTSILIGGRKSILGTAPILPPAPAADSESAASVPTFTETVAVTVSESEEDMMLRSPVTITDDNVFDIDINVLHAQRRASQSIAVSKALAESNPLFLKMAPVMLGAIEEMQDAEDEVVNSESSEAVVHKSQGFGAVSVKKLSALTRQVSAKLAANQELTSSKDSSAESAPPQPPTPTAKAEPRKSIVTEADIKAARAAEHAAKCLEAVENISMSLRLEEYDLGFFYDHQKYTAHVRQNWMYLLPSSVPLEQAAEMAKITQPSFLFARLELRYANENKVMLTTVTGASKKYMCDTPELAKQMAMYFARYANALKEAGKAAEASAVAATLAAAEKATAESQFLKDAAEQHKAAQQAEKAAQKVEKVAEKIAEPVKVPVVVPVPAKPVEVVAAKPVEKVSVEPVVSTPVVESIASPKAAVEQITPTAATKHKRASTASASFSIPIEKAVEPVAEPAAPTPAPESASAAVEPAAEPAPEPAPVVVPEKKKPIGAMAMPGIPFGKAAADSSAPAVQSGPCSQCDCTTFKPHAFKKNQCNLCYHPAH